MFGNICAWEDQFVMSQSYIWVGKQSVHVIKEISISSCQALCLPILKFISIYFVTSIPHNSKKVKFLAINQARENYYKFIRVMEWQKTMKKWANMKSVQSNIYLQSTSWRHKKSSRRTYLLIHYQSQQRLSCWMWNRELWCKLRLVWCSRLVSWISPLNCWSILCIKAEETLKNISIVGFSALLKENQEWNFFSFRVWEANFRWVLLRLQFVMRLL